MEIYENKALLIKTRNPQRYEMIPHQLQFDEDTLAVRWGLEECRVLRNLGVRNVPSPIFKKYKWPCRYPYVFAHQKETSAFLTMNRRAFVLSEPGTAKTLSALWAADYLMSIGEVRRVLVVCPLSIMQSAWMGDIGRSIIHRSAIVCHHSNAARRKEMLRKDYEIVIINYDGIPLVTDAIIADGRFDLIIADEASALKTATTRRWKAFHKLLRPDTYLWLMTGTPAAQSPLDAYGLAKLGNPSGVPPYFTAWRDLTMNKINRFKWAPKHNARDIVHKVLQPSVRYTKAECLDLPPVLTETRYVEMTAQQMKYYKLLKDRAVVQAAGEEISAPTAASMVSKLLQLSCIGYNTPVLTDVGWVPIHAVTARMRVWDGVEWVQHHGCVFKGTAPVVSCDGVRMTEEHMVLTVSGWRTAKEINDGESSGMFTRESVRLPNGDSAQRIVGGENKKGAVALSMRMWDFSDKGEPVPTFKAQNAPAKLRVSSRKRYTQDVLFTSLQNMGANAQTVLGPVRQGLRKLRSAWHNSMRSLAERVSLLLGRYGNGIRPLADAGAKKQRRGLHPGELRVGNYVGAMQQYAKERTYPNKGRRYDSDAGRTEVRYSEGDYIPPYKSRVEGGRPIAAGISVDEVFDLLNCGPRSRFVVRGTEGQHLLVHNCGAAYSDDGETVQFDCSPRLSVLSEVIEQTDRKVLIFALFRSSIDTIVQHLIKEGVPCGEIHGGVSQTKRADLINRFQTTDSPRVMVMQPQASAHGITLTAADTVIFYGPVMSVEQYVQCCARSDRQGQTADKVTVVHLQSSPIEVKMFNALAGKVSDHRLLTNMFEEEIKSLTTLHHKV